MVTLNAYQEFFDGYDARLVGGDLGDCPFERTELLEGSKLATRAFIWQAGFYAASAHLDQYKLHDRELAGKPAPVPSGISRRYDPNPAKNRKIENIVKRMRRNPRFNVLMP